MEENSCCAGWTVGTSGRRLTPGLTKLAFLHILFNRNYHIFGKGMEQEKYFSVGRQREAADSWERFSSEEKEVRL